MDRKLKSREGRQTGVKTPDQTRREKGEFRTSKRRRGKELGGTIRGTAKESRVGTGATAVTWSHEKGGELQGK